MSICPSVRQSLKISVTTEPIGFYSSEYIPISPVVVLSYFLRGWDTPNPPKNKKNPPSIFLFIGKLVPIKLLAAPVVLYSLFFKSEAFL